ncbi:uncharacterized protein [Diadema setosum]|uniref:uncharacterized protein n=1 Tax=Diadema setosum TaxID=31175 RepID=UPI003B3B7F59
MCKDNHLSEDRINLDVFADKIRRMACCAAGTHISKSQLIICIVGFVGFTILALGAVSDFWVIYGASMTTASLTGGVGSGNGTSSSSRSSSSSGPITTVLVREGLWRVCMQYVAYNTTRVPGHTCFFGISMPASVSTSSARYEVGYLLGSWVLCGLGVVVALIALVMSMAALRQKKNRTLIRSVSAVYMVSGLMSFVGLILFAVRKSKFMGQWSDESSPYTSAVLGWSFGISWVGLFFCVVSGLGHLWVVRRYEDSML